jgi:hypothetical protein
MTQTAPPDFHETVVRAMSYGIVDERDETNCRRAREADMYTMEQYINHDLAHK